MIKKLLLGTPLFPLLTLIAGGSAVAQDEQEDDAVLEEVIVTGVRFSLTEAVEIKRDSMEIVDALVAEDIGRFPDNQLVEALQRVPGVQVTARESGEVSSLQIRGLSDVATTINGRNIFTGIGRSVALQDIPATLVNRVDVYKTRSPDQIARSGSAKAFLLMPVLVPLADLLGLTRQTMVLGYAFGDGFPNMMYPTNAVLLISLGLTVVSYPVWLRWTARLWLVVLALSAALLALAVAINYGPF